MTLTAFLLARLAEDEEAGTAGETYDVESWTRDVPVQFWDYGETHIGYRRFLAEVEAKRRIVERCSSVGSLMPSEHLAQGVLSLLALPYADHPDFDEAWRP